MNKPITEKCTVTYWNDQVTKACNFICYSMTFNFCFLLRVSVIVSFTGLSPWLTGCSSKFALNVACMSPKKWQQPIYIWKILRRYIAHRRVVQRHSIFATTQISISSSSVVNTRGILSVFLSTNCSVIPCLLE